jgi:hypothetical protein
VALAAGHSVASMQIAKEKERGLFPRMGKPTSQVWCGLRRNMLFSREMLRGVRRVVRELTANHADGRCAARPFHVPTSCRQASTADKLPPTLPD